MREQGKQLRPGSQWTAVARQCAVVKVCNVEGEVLSGQGMPAHAPHSTHTTHTPQQHTTHTPQQHTHQQHTTATGAPLQERENEGNGTYEKRGREVLEGKKEI